MKTLCVASIFCCITFAVFSQNTASRKTVLYSSKYADKHAGIIAREKCEHIDPSKIDIVRDDFGVPHIFAKTDREVAYGLAWAHAEDDFETIQKAFLASRSMLGQHSGREGA